MNYTEIHSGKNWARLYCADCLTVLPTLGKVDAVITDPPYGVDFVGKETKHTEASGGYEGGDSDEGPRAVALALKNADRGVVFSGNRLLHDYPRAYEIGGVFCPSGAGCGRWGFTLVNPMLFYGKALPHALRSPAGFTSFATVQENGHPCPKPIEWMDWAVKKAALPDSTILDPFMGSGTTGVAALRHGCNFIGIEISPVYFAIAERRIRAEANQRKMF